MGCPYSAEELEFWDGCTNPMGPECDECGEWECEHNQHPEVNSEDIPITYEEIEEATDGEM